MIGRLENQTFKPSTDQLETLAEVLDFEVVDLYVDISVPAAPAVPMKSYNSNFADATTLKATQLQ